jgi:hypothetical protein
MARKADAPQGTTPRGSDVAVALGRIEYKPHCSTAPSSLTARTRNLGAGTLVDNIVGHPLDRVTEPVPQREVPAAACTRSF